KDKEKEKDKDKNKDKGIDTATSTPASPTNETNTPSNNEIKDHNGQIHDINENNENNGNNENNTNNEKANVKTLSIKIDIDDNNNEEEEKAHRVKEDSESDDEQKHKEKIKKLASEPYSINWNNRLYSAMRVLTSIVESEDVHDDCVVALDEWFETVCMDLLHRCSKAGYGILEAFLQLLKAILYRFAQHNDKLEDSNVANLLCEKPKYLLEIITRQTSTLVTRAIALELCPLLMVTSNNSEAFAQQCLLTVLDDGRFNPFEPGDINMTRTFHHGVEGEGKDEGKLRSINPDNPWARGYTINENISSLLFHTMNPVFIDRESVMRLTFMTVLKAMNTLLARIEQMEIELERRETTQTQTDDKDDGETEDESQPRTTSSTPNALPVASKSPRTPLSIVTDDYLLDDWQAVDRLEGEFDNTTARKIRNFFSRDASYTRHRILEMCCEEDDVLIDVLLELLMIETALRRSNSRLAKRIRYLFDPFLLLHDFIELVDADHSLLLDWMIGNETSFTEYLIRFCKRMTLNWHPTNADAGQVNRVMGILIRLRMHVQTLHERKLFPFSPKPLLKAMEKMEFCYESNEGAYSHVSQMWTDVQSGVDASKKKKEETEKESKENAPNAAKKINKVKVSELFLQNVKNKPAEDEVNKNSTKKGITIKPVANNEDQSEVSKKTGKKQARSKKIATTEEGQSAATKLDAILHKHKTGEGVSKLQ
ncbi:hypothetical protein RFI_04741, partial [Reticulomyxa filosa]